MKTFVPALAGLLLVAAPVAAFAGDPAVEAPLMTFLHAFNRGDTATALATAAPSVAITDEFAPYHWVGPTAFADWGAAFEADAKAQGLTDPKVSLGPVLREKVTGSDAYVIYPSTYAFKMKGVQMSESGHMTFALKKGADGWKITAWTWTSPDPAPVK